MNKCIIISIIYHEAEWMQTKRCIEATGLPVHYVERKPKGVGSLAEAINRGFQDSNATDYQYAWIVTNITFEPAVANLLIDSMDMTGVAVLHPSFDSDHNHERPDGSKQIKAVPFVEFTAAMVRTKVFKDYPLDEDCPYWGHDPDHGVRLWKDGFVTAVDHGVTINHTYIRNSKSIHEATRIRKSLRRAADQPTRDALERKYGKDWRWMFPRDEKAIEEYWKRFGI